MENSEKYCCEDCTEYEDCPRMKGVNICRGAEKWRKDHSVSESNKTKEKEKSYEQRCD